MFPCIINVKLLGRSSRNPSQLVTRPILRAIRLHRLKWRTSNEAEQTFTLSNELVIFVEREHHLWFSLDILQNLYISIGPPSLELVGICGR